MFGVRRVVSVADKTSEILILPLAPCGFDTPYLSLPPLGIAMMIPCTWGLSSSFLGSLPGSNSVGLIFSCVLVCFLH